MGSWTVVSFDSQQIQPPSRGGHASVSLGDKLICFGGADRTPSPFGNVWTLQSDGPGDHNFSWRRSMPMSATGQELLPRVGASMSAIDDKIYLYGGQDPLSGDCHSDVITLDTVTWQWAAVEVPGVKPPPRHSHCACILNNNILVVFGGAGTESLLGDLWFFDTSTRIWSHPKTQGSPPSPREMHTGCEISSSQFLIYGGRSATSQVLEDVAVFDAVSLQWQKLSPTGFPRCCHAAVAVPSWWLEGKLQLPLGPPSEQDDNLVVLAFGGYSGMVEDSLVCIDPGDLSARVLSAYNSGSEAAQRPKPRFAHTMAVIENRMPGMAVAVFGGVNSDEDLHDVAIWRPHPSQARPELVRTESEVLIQKPEGLPTTLAETIGPSFCAAPGSGPVLGHNQGSGFALDIGTDISHPTTMQELSAVQSVNFGASMPISGGVFPQGQISAGQSGEGLSQPLSHVPDIFDSAPMN